MSGTDLGYTATRIIHIDFLGDGAGGEGGAGEKGGAEAGMLLRSSAISLRARYAMSGAEEKGEKKGGSCFAICLGTPYAMSGTEMAYGAVSAHATRCPVMS
eukprot:3940993-Rhodomonas_salina.2